MASALELNAQATVINGHGLTTSPELLSTILSYRNLPTISLITNIYDSATNASANVLGNLWSTLDTVGTGVKYGQFLIDFYPSNISATSSSNRVGSYHTIINPVYDPNPAHWTTDSESGGVTKPIIGYTYDPVLSTASLSRNVTTQANLPFANGLAGFANVFLTSYSWASEVFDTVSSLHILKDKTYKNTALGVSGPLDLATNGIGSNGPVLANAISNWGTMYDIRNINKFHDPYVFGQNLLNQGLGTYGNLYVKLKAAGLNTAQLTSIPPNSTTTTYTTTTTSIPASYINQLDVPTVEPVVETVTVTGNSTDTILGIYRTIQRTDLDAMVAATGITNTKRCSTLADYLNFNLVVNPDTQAKLVNIGVTDFPSLGNLLTKVAGKGYYQTWSSLADTLKSIESPTLSHTSVSSTSRIITDSTVSTLQNNTGTGTGPFNNPLVPDLLGAVAGMPYIGTIRSVVDNYDSFARYVEPAVRNLDTAVAYYLAHPVTDSEGNLSPASLAPVTTAVNGLNTALNSIPESELLNRIQTGWVNACNQLNLEVTNLHKAGVTFNAGYQKILFQFGKNITTLAGDADQFYTKQFFANVISNDSYGDTIKIAMAEKNNSSLLSNMGISSGNDPQPAAALRQAKAQNIPITTYINQNQ
jgi:hypothetical protein